jgi:hypothetical protein
MPANAAKLPARMAEVSQNPKTYQMFDHWPSNKLPAVLVGDVAAAGISASLISPVITAIDRFVCILPEIWTIWTKSVIEQL